MGTNYYVIKNECKCCGRKDYEHIGKSSMGWSFSFQGTDEIRNYDQWLANVKTADRIEDEYERPVTLEELLDLIEGKREGRNHAEYCMAQYNNMDNWKVDDYNNSFSFGDFS
jgi:hypothetical protein